MAVAEQLSAELIERALTPRGVKYLRDRDDDFVVPFGNDPQVGGDFEFWIIRTGKQEDVLVFKGQTDRTYDRQRWQSIISLTNLWNFEKRWPKAYLQIPQDGTRATVIAEYALDCEKLITEQMVGDLIDHLLVGSIKMFEWFHERLG